jgi:hypothetical protein
MAGRNEMGRWFRRKQDNKDKEKGERGNMIPGLQTDCLPEHLMFNTCSMENALHWTACGKEVKPEARFCLVCDLFSPYLSQSCGGKNTHTHTHTHLSKRWNCNVCQNNQNIKQKTRFIPENWIYILTQVTKT